MNRLSDIGLIGLAVMGENLTLNIERNGFQISVFNRTREKTENFINSRAKGKNITGCYTLEEFVSSLSKPRKIILLVKAGKPVDSFIEALMPLLDKGDIIIDGGNSQFTDTERRFREVTEKGFYYLGCGVSGGELGALNGPSLMPGGSLEAWNAVKNILQAVCAKTSAGEACCQYVGSGASGHYVKMVHNGIEYGDIELICESYQIMRNLLGMAPDEIADVFDEWNRGKLDSYLIEITVDILRYRDTDGSFLINSILDTAGQKGTGKWACLSSLEEASALTLISEAVYSRILSAEKEKRVHASKLLKGHTIDTLINKEDILKQLHNALYMAKIISYAQGFDLLRKASNTYDWNLNFGDIALMWRGGCIIRSVFLGKIKDAFMKDEKLENLLLDDYFLNEINICEEGLRSICSVSALMGIAVPSFYAALSYFDGYRTANSPANLLQAQRDYFGAHTYERTDCERGKFFHTNWTGEGGNTTATTYDA